MVHRFWFIFNAQLNWNYSKVIPIVNLNFQLLFIFRENRKVLALLCRHARTEIDARLDSWII